ncbi:hypothetical protein [Echinimonas agarilytica]|uniref:Uncharacterized protein n=1 Tax=Echinimonas agarilytica TaxID=1215918 RepID=A0AA42B920_9GAMM|nr:hypothetical protein [Echinimonas agarilytica]MCM2681535.1 hypothetical protein [Echinimonas agarilytica]
MLRKIFILISLTQFAYASENLEPEDSQFSGEIMGGYTHLVLNYLSAAYSDDAVVRLIGFPSFSPEYALWVERKEEKYQIIYQSPEMQLWGYQMIPMMEQGAVQVMNDEGEFVKDEEGLAELESKYPKTPEEIPRKSCSKKIDKDLAEQIIFVWQEMLLETKYPRDMTMGLDGETYHFSGSVNGFGNYAGKVWSPNPKSRTGKLVEIAYLMTDYCLKGKRKIRKELVKKTESFVNQLKSTNKSMQPTANASAD